MIKFIIKKSSWRGEYCMALGFGINIGHKISAADHSTISGVRVTLGFLVGIISISVGRNPYPPYQSLKNLKLERVL